MGVYMDFVKDFDLFLFDFDGLLIDSEPLHFEAYIQTLAENGYEVSWSFSQYCNYALFESEGVKKATLNLFPSISEEEWYRMYAQKKDTFASLLEKKITLQPGVEDFLCQLNKENKTCVVVTNSPRAHIEIVKKKLPVLQTIPVWITREDYQKPKPHPEGYLKAIEMFPNKRAVGFEDSPKGIQSLLQTPAKSILISQQDAFVKVFDSEKVSIFSSFEDILVGTSS